MTRDDIIRMAQEVCETTSWKPGLGNEHVVEFMARFAALVAAAERDKLEPGFKQLEALMQVRETQPNKPCCLAEREACAKVCDERKHYWQRDDIRRHEDEHCATAIRARGNACSNRPENK